MTIKDVKKLVQYWVQGSDLDFASAQDIAIKAKRYVQACFFLHLSLEKALKALLVHRYQQQAPYSHNLVSLAQKSEIQFPKGFLELLSEVNEFNLEARYPDEKFTLYKKANAKFSKQLLKQGNQVRLWILDQLKN